MVERPQARAIALLAARPGVNVADAAHSAGWAGNAAPSSLVRLQGVRVAGDW